VVIVLTGGSGTSMPGQAAGRFLVSVLDQLGYRASLQVISHSVAYGRRLNTSRQRPQVGWVSWSQDYPAPSDFLSPLLACGSFLPGRDAAGYCNRWIGRQVAQARALQSRRPSTAEALWSHIDHELTDKAPWVPLFNPRSLVMLSSRVGNYQYDPYGAVLIDQLWVTGPSGEPAGQAARERPTSATQR
jgi:peptide/nickel transport system substrate-binding protein